MKASLAALLVVLASDCPLWAEAAKSGTRPKTILVIRHAEKPTDEGNIDLSAEGMKRAKALPDLFKKSASRPDPLPTPDFIFAATESDNSNRPVETVRHLAKKLMLDVNATFANKAYPKLVQELYTNPKYAGKTVLICWRHGEIPALVSKLGATNVPDKWDGHVFDAVWVVTFDEKGRAQALIQRRQALMPNDAKE